METRSGQERTISYTEALYQASSAAAEHLCLQLQEEWYQSSPSSIAWRRVTRLSAFGQSILIAGRQEMHRGN